MYDFDWETFWRYLWPPTAFENPLIAEGFVVTIAVAVVAQIVGVILGLVGALMQTSNRRVYRAVAAAYVTYFRGTPLLVQLMLIYFGLATIGLYNFTDIRLLGIEIPGVVQAGIVGVGINEGAYMSEIVRDGIISIPPGQLQAAKALGMTSRQAMRWIVLPQAAKVIIPPLGNEFNGMIKSTSLLVVIGGAELFSAFENVNARLFRPFELFLALSFYYLSFTLIWGQIQKRMEASLGEARAGRSAGTSGRLLPRIVQP